MSVWGAIMAAQSCKPAAARRRASVALGRAAAVAALALSLGGCLSRGDVTGSIGLIGSRAAEPQAPTARSEAQWRAAAQEWGKRYEARPTDKQVALNYAQALRALDQRSQAVAVLQQAALHSPKDHEVLAAYGKALIDVGRFKEAEGVLARAHTPDKPDWRVLSAQGTVADQLGDHAAAQRYYLTALKIVPGEPSVLSNLGLSYALAKQPAEAERVLRQAAAHPQADGRVKQNLALVLGLQGKMGEAEQVLAQSLPPSEVAANMAYLRQATGRRG